MSLSREQQETLLKAPRLNQQIQSKSRQQHGICSARHKIFYTILLLLFIVGGIMAITIPRYIAHNKGNINTENQEESIDSYEDDSSNLDMVELQDHASTSVKSMQDDDDDKDDQTPQLRSGSAYKSRSRESLGHMNVYLRKEHRGATLRRHQKFRFPVARYDRQRFPLKGPFLSFLPWIPIFADRLTKQTIIYSPTGGVYILPPVINFYGKMFSVAELIVSGYASLVSSGVPPMGPINMMSYFQPTPLYGAGIPRFNPLRGSFDGGIRTEYKSFNIRQSPRTVTNIDQTYESKEDSYETPSYSQDNYNKPDSEENYNRPDSEENYNRPNRRPRPYQRRRPYSRPSTSRKSTRKSTSTSTSASIITNKSTTKSTSTSTIASTHSSRRSRSTTDHKPAATTEHMKSDTYVIHERREHLPLHWNKHDKADRNVILPMRIGLVQQNLENMEEELMKVSDPTSPNYGRHLTPAQVADMFAPKQETIDCVLQWLENFGIKRNQIKLSASKGWLQFDITVRDAQRLMKTKYYRYKHKSGKYHIATEEYSVPSTIQKCIDFITPTLHFDVKLPKKPATNDNLNSNVQQDILGIGRNHTLPIRNITKALLNEVLALIKAGNTKALLPLCANVTTPACLRALYNLTNYTPKSKNPNILGITEYTPVTYNSVDLEVFLTSLCPSTPETTKPTTRLIDTNNRNLVDSVNILYNTEANLDLQYAVCLVSNLPVTLYQVGDDIIYASFNNFLDALDASYCVNGTGDDPTQDGIYPDTSNQRGAYKGKDCGNYTATYVISTSYGYNEADLTFLYENRQCNEYAKLGMMGVTILYSSGDYGVAGNEGYCLLTNGAETNSTTAPRFNPSFPGTCPYITSVGATQINGNVNNPESACEQVIYSGGGFSNRFAIPTYQKTAVQNYFKNHKPSYTAQQYNNSETTRGFPDVSANGANYLIYDDGTPQLVYGTSASSPVFASVIALIVDSRLAAGKGPIGFINPALYNNSIILNDITSGTNQGCNTNGFSAVSGWDPVTGLGTPNFVKMEKYFVSLP
ncbi:unnamed protein product [Adineta steineri]|uniref:tripeptidyl-peptidase II n=1 Tax=Adineta steineri TaxID=433720 RepID=A0A813WNA7_9BILA|nr:unnamed protein product [Adineta steineri]CAF3690808.1 unnamed protein product [Adineta steineri]